MGRNPAIPPPQFQHTIVVYIIHICKLSTKEFKLEDNFNLDVIHSWKTSGLLSSAVGEKATLTTESSQILPEHSLQSSPCCQEERQVQDPPSKLETTRAVQIKDRYTAIPSSLIKNFTRKQNSGRCAPSNVP